MLEKIRGWHWSARIFLTWLIGISMFGAVISLTLIPNAFWYMAWEGIKYFLAFGVLPFLTSLFFFSPYLFPELVEKAEKKDFE